MYIVCELCGAELWWSGKGNRKRYCPKCRDEVRRARARRRYNQSRSGWVDDATPGLAPGIGGKTVEQLCRHKSEAALRALANEAVNRRTTYGKIVAKDYARRLVKVKGGTTHEKRQRDYNAKAGADRGGNL